ncbi:MAG: translation initiation factor IF-2 [Thermodesulfobacteriota bacterium]
MTENEKEKQTVVEEKRIKPSVIRRRSKVKKPEVAAAAAEKAEPTAQAQAGAAEQVQPEAQAPAVAPEAPAAEAPAPVQEARKEKKEEKPRVKGRKAVPEKKEPARRAAPKKVKVKSAEEILAELKIEEAEETAVEAAPPAAEVAGKAEEKPAAKKEVKVFEKVPEQKRFFTAGRRPGRKGRYQQQRGRFGKGARPQTIQGRAMKKTEITVPKAAKRVVRIVEAISVADLSQKLGVKAGELIKKLMGLGIMATVNQLIDIDAVTLLAQDYGYEVESAAVQEETLIEHGLEAEAAAGALEHRAPVVTVMGHVDHGKTSLLDAIRKTNVVKGEAGGITQHIGAYHVHLEKGDVTFLDTPGHEAFTAMRARGARATDIVVLVVAADDGVMPQTIEAINHSKAAGVPIIVAINKIDLPQADPDRIKQELTQYGLVSEEWGGDTMFVEVSAKQGKNIKTLLEMILLQAEVLELKANPGATARGIVVEAKLDKGRGPVSTVLVQDGTLRVGDAIVTGVSYGRIRAMTSDWGKRTDCAGPSMPIEIFGLSDVPSAGEPFVVVKDEATAKQIASIRQRKSLEKDRLKTAKVSLTDLYDRINKGEVKELNLILKADVHGSIEAVRDTLDKLSTDAVKLKVIHSAVGGISEGDVMLAAASNAIIIGFNVRPEPKAQALAEKEDVDLRFYTIIYNLVDEIKSAMEGMLSPVIREEVIGRAEVRDVFRVTKVGNVAGCYITEGKATRGANVRLIRDNVIIYDGKLSSLKRFKDDVKEVATGYECGMAIEGYNDIKEGDVIELYTLKEEAAKL